MNHIFNLSLHRSATQSSHDLFRRCGLTAAHWVAVVDGVDYQAKVAGRETDIDFVTDLLAPVFSKYVAISDAPLSALFVPLSIHYPAAKFYAFHRPAEGWIKSVRRHIGDRPFVPFEKVSYWLYFRGRPESIADISDAELRKYHEWHHAQLAQHFKGHDNFLMLSLEEKGLGPRLAQFCGLPPLPLRVIDYAKGHDISVDPRSLDAEECE